MFGKVVSPGWDESRHSGGSLQPSFPLPEDPEPDRYYPLTPEATPRKVVSTFSCPPGHYLGPQQQCLPYDPTYELKQPFNVWPLLLVGIAAFVLLK